MLLRATYNPTTKMVNVNLNGIAVPGGSVAIGTFQHPDIDYPDSVVIYHGVRDLLYKRSATNPTANATFPDNITDMANISIQTTLAFPLVDLVSIDATAAAGNLAVGATRQIATAFTPANASDKRLTYVSSVPGKATVSATGLITGVQAGATVITITGAGNKTDTINITVA
jgi:hypothetical protein